jgi:(S)-ureidoglycine aminohydrolase
VSYTVIRPGNHYASRLPPFGDAPVVKLVTPRHAPARIGEYLLSLPAGGGTAQPVAPGFETFLYGLEGAATLSDGTPLGAGAWAYLPASASWTLAAGDAAARVLVVKRRYEPVPGHDAPGERNGHRDDVPWAETTLPGFRRRELLPVDDPAFDFAMSLLAFDAGVGLPFTEIHDEEHGLYMTAGSGTYALDGDEHEVAAGDFIYMAPYCPQGFTAVEAAEYLLYKDTWRDGF